MTDDEYRTTIDREQVERASRPFPDPCRVRRVRVDEPGHPIDAAADSRRRQQVPRTRRRHRE